MFVDRIMHTHILGTTYYFANHCTIHWSACTLCFLVSLLVSISDRKRKQHRCKHLHPQAATAVSLLLLLLLLHYYSKMNHSSLKLDSNHFHLLLLYNYQCYFHFPHTEAAQGSHCIFVHCVFSH